MFIVFEFLVQSIRNFCIRNVIPNGAKPNEESDNQKERFFLRQNDKLCVELNFV